MCMHVATSALWCCGHRCMMLWSLSLAAPQWGIESKFVYVLGIWIYIFWRNCCLKKKCNGFELLAYLTFHIMKVFICNSFITGKKSHKQIDLICSFMIQTDWLLFALLQSNLGDGTLLILTPNLRVTSKYVWQPIWNILYIFDNFYSWHL